MKNKNDNAHDGPVFTDEEPRIIGDIMLDNPALAAVLVKALQQRVETLEAQVENIEDFGVSLRNAARLRALEADVQLASEQRDSDREQMWKRIETLEAQGEASERVEGLLQDRIAVLQEENRNIIRTLESFPCGIERLIDRHGDSDLS